jgi:S1-C subfamily serine protease
MHTPRSRLMVGAFFSLGLAGLLWVGQHPAAGQAQGGKAKEGDVLPPVFNRPQPESIEDLKAIEKQVQAVLPKIMPAVVGVRIGPAQGSGVIIDNDGHVLTAGHVSGTPGSKADIVLPSGRTLKAKSLGRNGGIDSGMIQILDKGEYHHVEMGKSSDLKKGDWVLAIGHPGGFRSNRSPVVRVGRVLEVNPKFIRTDCALVGGDSGGPLFDMHGRVIGIHSRIAPIMTANIHVPVDTYRQTWDRLAKGESFGGQLTETQALVRSPGGKVIFEKSGKITTEDATDQKHLQAFAQSYKIKMKPGAIYTIDMARSNSKELDPYLRLEDSEGKQLGEDDDGGGNQNARIVFRPRKEDEYRVVATTCEPGQTGSYKVTVRQLDMPQLAGNVNVLPTLAGHKLRALQLVDLFAEAGGSLFVSGQLFDAQGKVITGQAIDYRWDKGDRKVFPDARGELRFRLGKDNIKNLHLDVPEGLKAALVLTDREGNPIVLDIGPEWANPKVASAGGKIVLEKKGLLTGDEPLDKLRDDLRKDKKGACFHTDYTIKLTRNATYTFDLESADFDAYLRLEDPTGRQVAEDDDSAGRMNSRIVYAPETDGVYRIVVTTCDPDQTGAYRLAVYQNDTKKVKTDGTGGAADGSPK